VLLAWDEERKRFIRFLRESGVPVLVLIIVGQGESRPLDPGPMKGNPENLHRLQVGKIREGLAQL
jgi:hypothetical protein